jgi:ABC-2 type transport system permease protein
MIRAITRTVRVYSAFAANMVKLVLAYSAWFWVELAGQILMMIIFVSFWKAVYGSTATVGGLQAQETIRYVLVAQLIAPLVRWSLVLDFGHIIREGLVALELVRPVDFQARYYVEWMTALVVTVLRQSLPLGLVAWLCFDLTLPADPARWAAFAVSLLLGNTILFFFDWTFASLAFYTTETWGLHVLREGVASFFSGALLPLAMLPSWLQQVAAALPFGQALNTPVALLTGITPLADVPRIFLTQLLWLVGLWALSRLTFRVASRKLTVQGG